MEIPLACSVFNCFVLARGSLVWFLCIVCISTVCTNTKLTPQHSQVFQLRCNRTKLWLGLCADSIRHKSVPTPFQRPGVDPSVEETPSVVYSFRSSLAATADNLL